MPQLHERGFSLPPPAPLPYPPPAAPAPDPQTYTPDGVRSFAAATAVSALRAVYTTDEGHVRYLSVFEPQHADLLVGVTITAQSTPGGEVLVAQSGRIIDTAWTWVPGRRVWVRDQGFLTQDIDESWPVWVPVGVASSPTTLEVSVAMERVTRAV